VLNVIPVVTIQKSSYKIYSNGNEKGIKMYHHKKNQLKPGIVIHTYNSSSSGGGDWEDQD
jgi:hypothetical protein